MKIILRSIVAILAITISSSAQTTPPAAKPKSTAPAKSTQPTSKPATTPATTPASKAPAEATKPATTVAPSDAVITIAGLCAANTPPANCGTKVTRADFEKLMDAISPNLPEDQRRQVANAYVQLLTVANEGQKLGVDKEPQFPVLVHIETLKLLATGTQKKMLEMNKPTPQEIETFYTENSGKFEELSIRRIMIPKTTDKDAKPEQIKALADKIHDRAAAGEDMDKLQAEAYQAVKAPGAPPTTSLGWKRHGSLDPRHEQQLANLRSGQVTPLIEDAQAFYIYKVDSKRMIPLQAVSKDIEGALQGQRAKEQFQKMLENVKPQLNEAYFGPEPPKQEAPGQQPPTSPK
ncbi:MAG: hypothetical protein JWO13_1934 [Acidobacteriales bacterium]|nr:hypothetical protein [Terriglobales bacterium]